MGNSNARRPSASGLGIVAFAAASLIGAALIVRGSRPAVPLPASDMAAANPPTPAAARKLPLSRTNWIAIFAGALIFFALTYLLVRDLVTSEVDAFTVVVSAALLAQVQFTASALREYESRTWLMASVGVALLQVLLAVPALVSDGWLQDVSLIVLTALAVAGFALVTFAEATGRFETVWAWQATAVWRSEAAADIAGRRAARAAARKARKAAREARKVALRAAQQAGAARWP